MATPQGSVLDIRHKEEHIRTLMRLKVQNSWFSWQVLSSANNRINTLLKVAQIFKASCIAYFTKSSEIDSLSAPVNQTRGDKGAEKSTFSSVRHNPNCLPYQVFSLIFFKFHETSSQYYLPVIFFCFILIAHLLEYVIKWSKERIVPYPYLYLPLTYLLCPGRHLQFSHHLSN